jgi:hypothetical protein
MLYAGAVSDLSIADTLEDPRWRPLMLAIAREALAQAPVRPEAFDGFDPGDLEGSLARLVTFNRQSAKSHSGIYRDPGTRAVTGTRTTWARRPWPAMLPWSWRCVRRAQTSSRPPRCSSTPPGRCIPLCPRRATVT